MKNGKSGSIRMRALVLSGAALLLTVSSLAGAASDPAADDAVVEEVIVTGSSIRGVAPVGSNLVSVGREQIEATGAQSLQQILKTIPSLSNSMANAQGSMAGSSYYNPTIHSLGSSASNSTLVLIDGHRMALGGTGHPQSDPSVIPPIAIERVEVLADGASSVYGSDAVAGVINFITRKNFEGVQLTAQHGFGDDYDTTSVGALWGHRWDTGSAMLAYGYSFRSNVPLDARDYTYPDQRPRGGTNFLSFSCSPATIQPAGSGNIYLSAVGYEIGPFSADVFMNYVGKHKNWGANTVAPITLDAIGLPTGGGDTVKANRLFDLNLAYKLRSVWGVDSQVFVDVANVFDKDPPFYNSANGIDPYAASFIGRVVTVGMRAKL